MKKLIAKIKGAKTMTVIAAVGALALAGIAATDISVGGGFRVRISSASSYAANNTNTTSLATNGLYTAAIGAAGATYNATETNLVCLNPGGSLNDNIVLSIEAQSQSAPSVTVGATNIQVVVTSTPRDRAATITNATATGWGGSTQPRSKFGTFTLTFDSSGNLQSTNIALSPNSSPAFNKSLILYAETIAVAVSNNFATNITVGVN